MPTSSTVANFDAALKQVYKPDNYRSSVYEKRPLLAMIGKDEDLGGRNTPLVNQFGNPQGVSATFANAQTNRTQIRLEDFALTRTNLYGVSTIDGELIENADRDRYAFLEALTAKIDTTMDSVADSMESYIPRSGTGSLARVASGQATATITLSDKAEVHNFEVGMILRASVADGGALRAGVETVKSVDRSAGTLGSTSATWNTVIALAANDFLYRDGDAQAAGSKIVVTGFSGWIPDPAPTAGDSHFGVDRSADSRLFGNLYDGSLESVEEALINGASVASVVGGRVDTFYVHHTKYRRLKAELSQKEFLNKPAQGPDGDMTDINFFGLRLLGDDGPMAIMPANKVQGTLAWGLQLDTWTLHSVGTFPRILDQDGLTILRSATADEYEVRVGGRSQVGCKKPGSSVRVKLP
jgi:hypothetical protein